MSRTLTLAGALSLTLVSLAAMAARPGSGPAPTYPPARAWHALASNDAATVVDSKLFMFGGSTGQPTYKALNDLWIYTGAGSGERAWTLAPTGRTRPAGHFHTAFACSSGECVAATGSNGVGAVKDTWIYETAAGTWAQLNCKRSVCPSGRIMATMAYDPNLDAYVFFGGMAGTTSLADTYVLDRATRRWSALGSGLGASARRSAAATFVPSVNQVVMFGGQVQNTSVLDDMLAWDGVQWQSVAQSGGPALHSHSMTWDYVSERLVVTGGYVDVSDTPNHDTWYFSFTGTSPLAGEWTKGAGQGCQSALSSDAVVHAGAMMARDIPSLSGAGTYVYFGGWVDLPRTITAGNTVECH